MLLTNSEMRRSIKTIGILILFIAAGELAYRMMTGETVISKPETTATEHTKDSRNDIIYNHRMTNRLIDKNSSNTSGSSDNGTNNRRTVASPQADKDSNMSMWSLFSAVLGRTDEASPPSEIRHIVFLKVHKAASTTVQSILFRFGYRRNLAFVLPVKSNYFNNDPSTHSPILPPVYGDHYDIFSVHCFYNHTMVSAIMPKKSVFIAIVRNPWDQFVSAVHYYRDELNFRYLKNISGDVVSQLVNEPNKYERSVLSYTMNSMARDFGFSKEHYSEYSTGNTSSSAHAYLNKMNTVFDLIMVAEQFDESLILMKRLLKWKLKDILYTPKNVFHPETNTSTRARLMKTFRERNKLDYLIYDHFQRKFQQLVKLAGESLKQETANFQRIVAKVQRWCSGDASGTYRISSTVWNEGFNISRHFCKQMNTEEMLYIELLKQKYYEKLAKRH